MDFKPRHLQQTAREVRDRHGYEMTPDQVAESLNGSIATVRAEMVKAGHPEFATMPDREVYQMLREAMAEPDPHDPANWSDEECDRIMADFSDEPDPFTPEQAEETWQSFRRFAGWDKHDAD